MNKKEKAFWILVYSVTAVLTLLPFFQVGLTNSDDFQYYNTAHTNWQYWVSDAKIYAHGAGRFYFLLTKYFYYIPYLVDSPVWTKFTQYVPLMGCYLLFSYLTYRIFKSRRLGALTLLLLIFNMSVGGDHFSIPTAFPFYFTFSLLIFMSGILLFLNYTERNRYWRVLVSALVLFISCLFYENYLIFTLLFCCYILIRNWRRYGFIQTFKSKSFYKELIPYVAVLVLYMACYVGYRQYLIHTIEDLNIYDGTVIAHNFRFLNFFKILNKCTFYNLPCKTFFFDKVRYIMAENSPLITGHYDNVFFVLTHAPAVAYLNALLQCGILWFIIHKADFRKISWTAIVIGVVSALLFALSAHVLIAIAEKYNSWNYQMNTYVTSFYSYFGIILTCALLITASIKACFQKNFKLVVCIVWCILLFAGSVLSYYTNDLLSKEWKKRQNPITVTELVAQEDFFNKIPENSILYTVDATVSSNDYRYLIQRVANRYYKIAFNQEELMQCYAESSDCPLYFIQTTESEKQGEFLMAFSHITALDTSNILYAKADEADVFYYSPTKDFTLCYNLYAKTDSARIKAITILSATKHEKLTHINIQEPGMNPFGFCISNMLIPTTDTLWLP